MHQQAKGKKCQLYYATPHIPHTVENADLFSVGERKMLRIIMLCLEEVYFIFPSNPE